MEPREQTETLGETLGQADVFGHCWYRPHVLGLSRHSMLHKKPSLTKSSDNSQCRRQLIECLQSNFQS